MPESNLQVTNTRDAFVVESERLTRGVRNQLDGMDSVLGIISLRGVAHTPGKSLDFLLYQVYMDIRKVRCGIETVEHHAAIREAREVLKQAGFPASGVAIDDHGNSVITFWLRPGRRGPEAWGSQV